MAILAIFGSLASALGGCKKEQSLEWGDREILIECLKAGHEPDECAKLIVDVTGKPVKAESNW